MVVEIEKQNTTLPDLFQKVLDLCQLVQFIDAAVGRGYVKATSEKVTVLTEDDDFREDALIAAWKIDATIHVRGYLLRALLNVTMNV